MVLRVEIDMDNLAFDDGPADEVTRILTVAGYSLRHTSKHLIAHGYKLILKDINGDKVGKIWIENE